MSARDAAPALPAPPHGWTEGRRELRFTFGEFRIWTARPRAWVLDPAAAAGPERLASLPAFADVPREIAVLAIHSLPVESDLPRLTRLPGALRYVPAHFTHHCIELEGTFEDYLARLSGKSRHEMARKARRFTAWSGGRHEIREFREPADMAAFVRLAAELSKTTYQGRMLDVGLPDDAAFVKDVEDAAARGDVRGYLLCVDGRARAFGYCRARGDVLAFEHTGYDAAAAPHSPGIFLLQEMLRRVHAERRWRIFDFGSGDAQYKRSYATRSGRCATVLQFRRTLRNAVLIAAHRALTAASDGCVRLLDAIGLKRRIRRLLRSAGSRSKADGAAAAVVGQLDGQRTTSPTATR